MGTMYGQRLEEIKASSDVFHRKLVEELEDLRNAYREFRREDPEASTRDWIADRTAELAERLHGAYQELGAAGRQKLKELEGVWEAESRRDPTRALLDLARWENKYSLMSEAKLRERGTKFITEPGDHFSNPDELAIFTKHYRRVVPESTLKEAPDPLLKAIDEKRETTPWMRTPEAAQAEREASYANIPTGVFRQEIETENQAGEPILMRESHRLADLVEAALSK